MGGGIFYNFGLAITPIGNIRNLCQNRASNDNRSEDEQDRVVHDEQTNECDCYDKKNHGILLFTPKNDILVEFGNFFWVGFITIFAETIVLAPKRFGPPQAVINQEPKLGFVTNVSHVADDTVPFFATRSWRVDQNLCIGVSGNLLGKPLDDLFW